MYLESFSRQNLTTKFDDTQKTADKRLNMYTSFIFHGNVRLEVLDCTHSLALPARYMGARLPIYQV
jgi:hypothetical protein